MLEAVNSTISNSPLLRGSTEQVAVARSFAANPDRVQEVPQAPYISPYVHVDVRYNQAVLQLRNGESGDVESQIPSEERLVQIREAKSRELQESRQPEARQQAEIRPQQQPEAPRTEASSAEIKSPAPASPAPVSQAPASQTQLAAFEAGAQTAQPTDSGSISISA